MRYQLVGSPVEQPHSNDVPTFGGVPLKPKKGKAKPQKTYMGVKPNKAKPQKTYVGVKPSKAPSKRKPPTIGGVPIRTQKPQPKTQPNPQAKVRPVPGTIRSNQISRKPFPKPVPTHSTHVRSHGGGGGGGGGNGGGGPTDFSSLLASLLGQSSTSKMLPTSLADDSASPYTSLAATLGDQISQLPKAKAQALKNISDWFGQVQSAQAHGAAKDKAAADAGASSMEQAAKGIMASLGGSAMAGSGEVGAMGANDANTMTAIGTSDADLANQLAPIFKLASADAKNTRAQQYDNQRLDLQDQQGQALGQADASRAQALMQILQANNQGRQTNFGNESGLLNTLAGLQISGMNAASQAQERSIMNALHMSEIQKNAKKQMAGIGAMSPSERSGLATALNNLIMDPNSGGLKPGMSWPTALQDVRNYLRTQGLNPFSKQVVSQFVSPILANAGIQFQNPNTLYHP